MDHRNLTPFHALTFLSLDTNDVRYHVVVMRISYDLRAISHGDYVMELSKEQPPLVMKDQYYGDINTSSVMQESDLAPYKPKCDVIVTNAVAYAPEKRPHRKIVCSVRVGNVVKSLCATGPRIWQWRLMRWVLLEPELVAKVPVQYEYAFGGRNKYCWPEKDKKAPFDHVCMLNPLGKGWMHSDYPLRDTLKEFPAPQIESEDEPVVSPYGNYLPQGFGVIGRAWSPRLQLAGTYDEKWKKERWPGLPKDFDFAYWNGAHPDLQIPFPAARTEIELRRLTPDGKLRTCLPEHRAIALARLESGTLLPLSMPIDTIIIDPQAMQICLVHRLRIEESLNIRVLESRFTMDPQAPLLRMQQPQPKMTGEYI